MDLRLRLESAETYFRYLSTVRLGDWESSYEQYVQGTLSIPQAAVLVHPMWREGFGRDTPRHSPRSFTSPPPSYEVCASETVWGYSCPLETQLQTDHRFPWGLGGPTTPSNAVYLCKDHNLMKGHDVHLLSWTDENFAWLHDEIEEVRNLITGNR